MTIVLSVATPRLVQHVIVSGLHKDIAILFFFCQIVIWASSATTVAHGTKDSCWGPHEIKAASTLVTRTKGEATGLTAGLLMII